jgi:hypothetical protein
MPSYQYLERRFVTLGGKKRLKGLYGGVKVRGFTVDD